jgi:hypothetical protein
VCWSCSPQKAGQCSSVKFLFPLQGLESYQLKYLGVLKLLTELLSPLRNHNTGEPVLWGLGCHVTAVPHWWNSDSWGQPYSRKGERDKYRYIYKYVDLSLCYLLLHVWICYLLLYSIALVICFSSFSKNRTYCLNYYNFITSLDIWINFITLLFFDIVWIILSLLFSINGPGILIGIALDI